MKKITKNIRQISQIGLMRPILKKSSRKQRFIVLGIILLIVVPLVTNTFLQRQKEAKADSLLKFDEGYGTAVNASSGSASGTITGATWKTEDLCFDEKCLYFDGGDWINFGDEATYNFASSTDFTIEFWFRHAPATAT